MEKRIQLMLVALLAPEIILTFAFFEWLSSSDVLTGILGKLFRGIMRCHAHDILQDVIRTANGQKPMHSY